MWNQTGARPGQYFLPFGAHHARITFLPIPPGPSVDQGLIVVSLTLVPLDLKTSGPAHNQTARQGKTHKRGPHPLYVLSHIAGH